MSGVYSRAECVAKSRACTNPCRFIFILTPHAIPIALSRASTAREAITIIDALLQTYGYSASGESFSIADTKEVWLYADVEARWGDAPPPVMGETTVAAIAAAAAASTATDRPPQRSVGVERNGRRGELAPGRCAEMGGGRGWR